MFVSFTDQKPVLFDSYANPLSYGEVTFCDQGTTTPKTVYSDEGRTVALTNPQILDISGRPVNQIFLGVGDYTVFVKRFIGDDIMSTLPADWTDDNQFDISGLESPVSIATTATVDTIADLKNIDSDVYQSVTVLGYFAKGDCPARVFIWSASEAGAENLGTIVSSSLSVSGRWMYQPISEIDVRTFGAIPSGANCNGAITNAEAWANSLTNHAVTLYFPKGIYSVSGTVTQPIRIHIRIDKGVTFLNTVAGNYKLDIQSGYQIDLESELQGFGSTGTAGLRFSGSFEGVVKFEWLGKNEIGFNRFIVDVASLYVLRVNELVDASLVTSGGTRHCHLSFGPVGSLLLDGSGYEIKPSSLVNENTDGCFYYVVAGRLDLGLLKSVNTSWFRAGLDASLLFNRTYQHTAGTVLNVDANCTVSNGVATNTGWVIVAGGGFITLDASLTCGAINAGDVGLFNGPSWVEHYGMTNLAWFLYANTDKDEALNSAINSAQRSTSATLDGRNIAQTYSDSLTFNSTLTFKNVVSNGVQWTLTGTANFVDCSITGTTYALVSAAVATINISGSTVTAASAITTTGNTKITNSTISGACQFSGNIIADGCVFTYGITVGSLRTKGQTQITNCQIRNPIIHEDVAGVFGNTLIANNIFIGTDVVRPNWNLYATTASSLASSVIIQGNIFTGVYGTSTDAFICSVAGAGSFALLQNILITDNKTTSANVVIKATKGFAIGAYTFSLPGSGLTVGTVNLNLTPVFVIPSYVLNADHDIISVQQPASASGIAVATVSAYLATVSGFGYVSGTSPVPAYINFDLYR